MPGESSASPVSSVQSSVFQLAQIKKEEPWSLIYLDAPSKKHGHLQLTPPRTASKNSYTTLPSRKVHLILAVHCHLQPMPSVSTPHPFCSTTLQGSSLAAGFVMQDLRSMVAHLSGTDLAVAGHAVALAGWHQVTAGCCHCLDCTCCLIWI